MKKFSLTLFVSLITCILLVSGCSKSSNEPEAVTKSSISVTGDISEAYDVLAYFSIGTYSSDSEEKQYFTFLLMPTESENPLALTLLYKSGAEHPGTGTYQIGPYAYGDDIPEENFGGSFSPKSADDLTGYLLNSGELNISKSSSELISGDFNASGYFVQLFDRDTTRIVTISGKFNAGPVPTD